MAVLTDAPNTDVVPFKRPFSDFTVYGRHSDGEDKVVHLLGSEPIICDVDTIKYNV